MAVFIPSPHQSKIFDWILNSADPTLVVEAIAGSGKSTTAVEGVDQFVSARPRAKVLIAAFSKEIEKEMTKKIKARGLDEQGVMVKTVHGLGFGAISYALRSVVKRVEVVASKYRDEVKRWRAEYDATGRGFAGFELEPAEHKALGDGWAQWQSGLLQLWNIGRLELVEFQADSAERSVQRLANKHGIELDDALFSLTMRSLSLLAAYGRGNQAIIDFTDMLWLPYVEGYRPRNFDLVVIDECQDLSRAQLELVLKARSRTGRMMFIGDRKQAIFGFAGADADSFQNIIRRTRAITLPLSVCYRCPTSVLDLARELCPQIEARDGAPEGEVTAIMRDELAGWVEDGDMILCRLTAPLLGACFELLANGIPAVVRGRNIADGLVAIIEKIGTKSDFGAFGDALNSWLDERIAYARRRHDDEDRQQAEIDQSRDQAECLRIIWARAGQRGLGSFASMISMLRGMFSDERESVVLSTIHRAKGLESQRVFIMQPDLLRRPRARSAWQRQQEHHLHYVALTRAMETLVFVEEPAKRAA